MPPNPSKPILRRFISEDPRMRKYTPRLTTDDKAKLEPLLRRLHQEAVGREIMLQESRNEIGKSLTFHQLDRLRIAFGLNISSQPSKCEMEHVHEEFLSQPRSSSAHSTMEDAGRGNVPNAYLSELDTAFLLQDPVQIEQPLGEIPADLVNMGVPICYNEQAVEDEALSQDEDEPLSQGVPSTARRSDSSSATMTDLYGDPEQGAPMLLDDQYLSTLQGCDGALNSLLGGEYLLDNKTIPVSVDEKSAGLSRNPLVPAFEHLDRFEIHLDPSPGRGKAMKYSPLVPALGIYSMAVTRSDSEPETIARLNQTANVLRSLRAFGQAFDVYLFIFCHFRELKQSAEPPHPQLVMAVINCGRCAQTENHIRVSNKILLDLQQRLEMYYEFSKFLWTQDSTHPWRYLETLRQRFLPVMTGNPKSLTAETTQDTAYWVACAIAMSQSTPVRAHDLVWDSVLPFRHEDVLQHFRTCQIIRHVMLNALQQVHDWVQRNPYWLNSHLGKLRWPSEKQRAALAQALSCFLLEDHLGTPCLAEDFLIEDDADDHQGFPCDLGGQAVAVIPYVLVEWTQPLSSPTSLLRPKILPVRSLLNAIDEMWNIVRQGSGEYDKYIDLCLKHWGTPTTLNPAGANIVSPDRLRRIAAGTAELMSSVDVVTAAKTENARNGLRMRESTTRQQDLELDIDRLSISSAPTLTESYTSSNSSDYRLFSRLRNSITASLSTQPTRSSGRSSSQSSMRFSRTTGLHSSPPLSSRASFGTISSDVTMTNG